MQTQWCFAAFNLFHAETCAGQSSSLYCQFGGSWFAATSTGESDGQVSKSSDESGFRVRGEGQQLTPGGGFLTQQRRKNNQGVLEADEEGAGLTLTAWSGAFPPCHEETTPPWSPRLKQRRKIQRGTSSGTARTPNLEQKKGCKHEARRHKSAGTWFDSTMSEWNWAP